MTDTAARALIEAYFSAVFEMVDPKIFTDDLMECLSAKGFKIVAADRIEELLGENARLVGIIEFTTAANAMQRNDMSKIFTYSQDYMDGFRTAYILGPASALAQIHKWEQDGHKADGKKIIDGLNEANEQK